MTVLLTGAKGQLGRCIQDLFASTEYELIALDRAALDISDAEAVFSVVADYRPRAIINAAAYTAVDKAEAEPELAAKINTVGPANLARAAERIGAVLIHISTDYVFDGKKTTPYVEDDETNPTSTYGKTKLEGESGVRRYCSKHVILRTAWVFSEYGNNFVKTMLRLGGEREALSVVADQVGCPTYAGDIAKVCLSVCDAEEKGRGSYGIYHYCGNEAVSWYEFASEIFKQATAVGALPKRPQLTPISTRQYPTPAARPPYSVMATDKLNRDFSLPAGHWKKALSNILA